MGRIRTRLRATLGVAVVALALTGAAPAHAHERQINTWQGICEDIPGTAHWEEAIGLLPGTYGTLLRAEFAGGSCDGILNGRPIEDGTATVDIDYRGFHTCEAGVVQGPLWFTVNGVRFHGLAQYQRAGIVMRVMIESTDGPQPIHAVVRGYGGDNDIQGSDPNPRPLFDYLFGCVGEGVSEAGVMIQRSIATQFVTEEEHHH